MDYSLLVGVHKINHSEISDLPKYRSGPLGMMRFSLKIVCTHPWLDLVIGKSSKATRFLFMMAALLQGIPFKLLESHLEKPGMFPRNQDGSLHEKMELYYVGIIDLMQPWTLRKVCEAKIKSVLFSQVHFLSHETIPTHSTVVGRVSFHPWNLHHTPCAFKLSLSPKLCSFLLVQSKDTLVWQKNASIRTFFPLGV